MTEKTPSWSIVCHSNYGGIGKVAAIRWAGNKPSVVAIPTAPASGKSADRRPIFLGVSAAGQAVLLDSETQSVAAASAMPVDANPLYAYPDSANSRLWFSNDGDEETGNDPLNCGTGGSSVTVMEQGGTGKLLKTLCVGRGHHVTAFTVPSTTHPSTPRLAYVSNLLDGTISVVGNDSANPQTFLKIITTINLCEPAKEKAPDVSVPNNAFPHGMVYATLTGRIYNLNNGYGTITVINPATHEIEKRIALSGCSNLLLSPDGRFLIGKGADRKTDPDHVLGKVAVVDIGKGEVVTQINVPDFYPSTFRFSPDGRKLYVTSAATGKGRQKENLAIDKILVFDAAALPALKQLKEIRVGAADCSRRPIAFIGDASTSRYVFVPNPTDGTLTILDGARDEELATVTLGEPGCEEVLFSFWNGDYSGC